MKKTLTILSVLLIAAFAVFAVAEGNTITLNSIVSPATDYLFTLTETSSSPYDASAAGSATFIVTSDHVMNFGSDAAAIDIDLSVTPWYGTSLHEENALTIGSVVATTGEPVGVSITGFTVDLGSGYKSTFNVGTFSVSWVEKNTLAADSYTATVTIAYTQV
ncbi:MAG: hypothetical protein WC162_11510 [Sphaerochaetaceae bacterium]